MKAVEQPLKSPTSDHEERMTTIETVCAGGHRLSC
jgi:hypothetical protein